MADFTLNAPGATNNPWAPANIIVPVATIRSDTTGFRASAAGVFDAFAHDTAYGSTITTSITVASGAASNGDEIWLGAVVRSGTNAGAGVGVAYTAFGIQVISWDKTGAETTISANVTHTRANGDTVVATVAIVGSTASISATINGTPVTFSASTTSALTSETTLAAGGSFFPQNNNSFYLSQMTGTGVVSGTFTLPASAGTFSVAGQSSTLKYGQILTSAFGSYSLGGQAVTFLNGPANFTLLGATGNYALLGAPASSAYSLLGGTGSFSFLGSDAGLGQLTAYNLAAAFGAYAVSGQSVNQNNVLVAGTGQFLFIGQAQGLTWPQAPGLVDPGNLVYKRVFVITPTGSMRPWVDYLPVEFIVVTAAMADRYDFNGALAVKVLSSSTGLVPWTDYLPVAPVSGTHTWTTDDSTGYIPMVKLV